MVPVRLDPNTHPYTHSLWPPRAIWTSRSMTGCKNPSETFHDSPESNCLRNRPRSPRKCRHSGGLPPEGLWRTTVAMFVGYVCRICTFPCSFHAWVTHCRMWRVHVEILVWRQLYIVQVWHRATLCTNTSSNKYPSITLTFLKASWCVTAKLVGDDDLISWIPTTHNYLLQITDLIWQKWYPGCPEYLQLR